MAEYLRFHLVTTASRLGSVHLCFQVAVQVFVWVQFWQVTQQEEQFDLGPVRYYSTRLIGEAALPTSHRQLWAALQFGPPFDGLQVLIDPMVKLKDGSELRVPATEKLENARGDSGPTISQQEAR